jgi:hypothetical protein
MGEHPTIDPGLATLAAALVALVAGFAGVLIGGWLNLRSAREAREDDRRDRRAERRLGDLRAFQDALEANVASVVRVIERRNRFGPAPMNPMSDPELEDLLWALAESVLHLETLAARIHDDELDELVDHFERVTEFVGSGQRGVHASIDRIGRWTDRIRNRVEELLLAVEEGRKPRDTPDAELEDDES